MDYTQNLKKGPVKAKKGPSQNFYRVLSAHFALLQYKEFAVISSNLTETEIFKNVWALWALELELEWPLLFQF